MPHDRNAKALLSTQGVLLYTSNYSLPGAEMPYHLLNDKKDRPIRALDGPFGELSYELV